MLHPDYPFWTLVGAIVVLLPVRWHWRVRNVSTVCLMAWLAIINLTLFINTVIWADNYADVAPVWCDISSRILVLIPYAIPLCSLSQMRRLASIASPHRSVITASAQFRRQLLEGIVCVGLPILVLPLYYIVQGHRYDIVETIGCNFPIVWTWPSLVIEDIGPLLISFASLVYAGMALRGFLVRRLQFRSVLASSESGFNTSRYLRLIALAMSDTGILICGTLFRLIYPFTRLGAPLPYKSWASIHSDFSMIDQLPVAAQDSNDPYNEAFLFYLGPTYALVFFIFFGFGEEAIAEYVEIGERMVVILRRLTGWKTNGQTNHGDHRIPTLGSTVVTLTGDNTGIARHDSVTAEEGRLGGALLEDTKDKTGDSGPFIHVLVERYVAV